MNKKKYTVYCENCKRKIELTPTLLAERYTKSGALFIKQEDYTMEVIAKRPRNIYVIKVSENEYALVNTDMPQDPPQFSEYAETFLKFGYFEGYKEVGAQEEILAKNTVRAYKSGVQL